MIDETLDMMSGSFRVLMKTNLAFSQSGQRPVRFRRVVLTNSTIVLVISLSVVAAYAFGTEAFQTRWPSVFVMKPNTAFGLLFLALAEVSIYRRTQIARGFAITLSLAVLLICIATFAEYSFHIDLGIDQLVFHDYAAITHPGRSSEGTIFCSFLLSVAVMLAASSRTTPAAQVIFFFASGVPLIAFGGYVFRTPGLSSTSHIPIISLHTSISQILVCLSGICLEPEKGFMRLVVSESLAGSLVRRLIPMAMTLPLVAGLFILFGESGGLYTTQFGSALLVSTCALIFAAAVWTAGSLLWKTEERRERAELRQEQAEAAVRQSETNFEVLADSMPQIVWAAQPDGTVDYYNQRWFEYTGEARGTHRVKSWTAADRSKNAGSAAKAWHESVTTGQPHESEIQLRGADGNFRTFLSRALPNRDAAGEIIRWYGTLTDLHDIRELQAERERLFVGETVARAEAERASRMKDEFLATLSHELRTPLNAILGWSQIMQRSKEAADIEQGLAVIERNARAQAQIIEDLLDMSRIISGKVRLDVQRLDLSAIVQNAIETTRPTAEARGIRLQSVIDPLHGVVVSGDPNRLQQVLWNLLTNAIKFTPKNGQVRVLLERVNSHLEISVIDTGEGIQPEFLPFVFDRFRQADASTTRRHGGLGLGLSIVKQLVELHGGSVRVKSAGAGQGATFSIALPLLAIHPEAEEDSERRHPRSRPLPSSLGSSCNEITGVRVLIIDDEPDARALVKRLLEDCGAIATVTASAEEAIRLIETGTFDVLVSDIGMPDEDGYSLIKRVRRLGKEKGGNIPAIALTAYARAEDRVKAVSAGFMMHVAKPVEPVELITMVAGAAGRTGR